MSNDRFLRSKQLRNALWLAAGGKCQRCGCELPEDWHADHIIPWAESRQTNVHEMQALCPACNLSKGANVLREHQTEMERICSLIMAGRCELPDFIFVHAAPGAGKSSIPVIAAHILIEKSNLIDKICWVVPNGALREQAVRAFARDRWEHRHFGHNLEITQATNEQNPSKGSAGYVTTYQALRADSSGINVAELKRHRYVLVLDEFHHLAQDTPYTVAVKPLVAEAKLVICMTGTLERSDRMPIYPLPYRSDRHVDKTDCREVRWITYGIRSATEEMAIINVHFTFCKGAAKWYDMNGIPCEANALGDNKDALFTALKTEFAKELLDDCLASWQQHHKCSRRSKMLVVCADIAQAKLMLKHLQARGVTDAEIATYDEPSADESIRRFREGSSPTVLVTVAKAYEGLDVPCITHLACLTHIRSKPWIEQMLARGWRHDTHPDAGPWASQIFHAFVPDDDAMKDCIRDIADEQVKAAKDLHEKLRHESETKGHDDGAAEPNAAGVVPLTSTLTGAWASDLHGDSLTPEETEMFSRVAAAEGLSLTPLQVKRLVDAANAAKASPPPEATSKAAPEATLDRRLEALRNKLVALVNRAAGGDGELCKRINGHIKQMFGSREAMTEKGLIDAVGWVRRAYAQRLGGESW